MSTTISRLYDDYGTAMQVVKELEAAGLPSGDVSVLVRKDSARGGYTTRHADGTEAVGAGAGIGAVLGGTAGALAGLGVIAIPGIGPVVAAGWLAATAAGAVAGGAAGGIIGALTQAGVSKEDAHAYAEGIRRGGTLVTARVPERDRARYEAIMDRQSVDMEERAATYRQGGWSKFDENAPPYRREHQGSSEHELSASDLETENANLRRLVADLSLENQRLKDNVAQRRP
jgi:hypothetical protein